MAPETIVALILPTFVVALGILVNRFDSNRLDNRITSLDGSLRAQIAASEQSLRSEIATMRKQIHDDVLTMVGVTNELDKRIARLEPH